jgi:hypothetical protein
VTQVCLGKWFVDDEEPGCDKPAVVCSECVRALALMWWDAIARHSSGDPEVRCALCEIGAPEFCGDHAIVGAAKHREMLRSSGNAIEGEPRWGGRVEA